MEETPTISLLLTLTITLLLFPTTTSTEPLFSTAAQTLTNSGFLSMGLTLRLASPTLHLASHSPATTATIFVPSDAAFLRSGPLPISLLQYHILPTRLPLQHLTTLPPSTPLPTLLPDSSLTVTVTASSFSPPQLSINNVTVANAAVFDDGSLLMLVVDDFFNSSSLLLLLLLPESSVPLNTEPFAAVSDVLRSNGCSIMATFLEAQLAEFTDGTKLTVFAPVDVAVADNVRNIGVIPRMIN